MKPKFQSRQQVIVNAPLEKVWEYNMDLSKIAEYHPRVNKVDLVSGSRSFVSMPFDRWEKYLH